MRLFECNAWHKLLLDAITWPRFRKWPKIQSRGLSITAFVAESVGDAPHRR
jgi:hypothetical protein